MAPRRLDRGGVLCRECLEPIYPRQVGGRWVAFDERGNEHTHSEIAETGPSAPATGRVDEEADPAPSGDSVIQPRTEARR